MNIYHITNVSVIIHSFNTKELFKGTYDCKLDHIHGLWYFSSSFPGKKENLKYAYKLFKKGSDGNFYYGEDKTMGTMIENIKFIPFEWLN